MRRGLMTFGVTTFVFALHCGGGSDAHFDPAQDAAFVASVTGEWRTADGTNDLVICEDTSPGNHACDFAVADGANAFGDCGIPCHRIEGGGRSREETLAKDGCGCGAPVASLAVTTQITLGDGRSFRQRGSVMEDSQGITLSAEDDAASSDGQARADGTLTFTVWPSAPPGAVYDGGPADPRPALVRLELVKVGSGGCP